MNWGIKLMIGMLCFMSFIIVLAVLLFNSKTDALVDTDYYEKGLAYDQDYQRKEQVKADNAAPEITITDGFLLLTFKDKAAGKLTLVRSSDKQMDRKTAIQTDTLNRVKVPLEGIANGQWRMIVAWSTNGKAYLNEQEINIP